MVAGLAQTVTMLKLTSKFQLVFCCDSIAKQDKNLKLRDFECSFACLFKHYYSWIERSTTYKKKLYYPFPLTPFKTAACKIYKISGKPVNYSSIYLLWQINYRILKLRGPL